MFQQMNPQEVMQYFALKEEMSIRTINAYTEMYKALNSSLVAHKNKPYLNSKEVARIEGLFSLAVKTLEKEAKAYHAEPTNAVTAEPVSAAKPAPVYDGSTKFAVGKDGHVGPILNQTGPGQQPAQGSQSPNPSSTPHEGQQGAQEGTENPNVSSEPSTEEAPRKTTREAGDPGEQQDQESSEAPAKTAVLEEELVG